VYGDEGAVSSSGSGREVEVDSEGMGVGPGAGPGADGIADTAACLDEVGVSDEVKTIGLDISL